jgi:hypothetical protein
MTVVNMEATGTPSTTPLTNDERHVQSNVFWNENKSLRMISWSLKSQTAMGKNDDLIDHKKEHALLW